ncbi:MULTISPECIES: glucoamylase family protein [unclassified Mesorhizobium]|uniref:glucoamylase family protein n=1 Tax=unclassified Mesorhizobium TaxID=325217 RepID=UPI001FEE3E9D|nr:MULTISPECIES: glucoamylase family protein [unclassified Mesorhizobium]
MQNEPKQEALDDDLLATLQSRTFDYFLYEANEANGLVADRTRKGSPASIAAVGLALTSYPVGVVRGFMTRKQACARTLTTLRFFHNSTQSTEPDATGYKGFYYHFLDMQTGRRAWQCELSTIDTALLIAGILTAGAYFREDSEEEKELRTLSEALYERVDWDWARNGGPTITHGWTPERGFIGYRWEGYDEALILYVLGLGSPTHALPPESYAAWLASYRWKKIYGQEFAYAGPLFIHQLSHIWLDFRGIRDTFMREHDSDYFENSSRATHVQRQYAIRNPLEFDGYHGTSWGVTASDGPGWQTRRIGGIERRFYGYRARGAPFGPDDGTLSPWATAASLPFAPEIVLPALRHFQDIALNLDNSYGFKASFNPTLKAGSDDPTGWVAPDHLGLNQGPIVLMIENQRSEFAWRLMRTCPHVIRGLRRAGFSKGWLDG